MFWVPNLHRHPANFSFVDEYILITINFIYCDVTSRCRAAWNYVLELSKEKYDVNIILQILETVNKISSSSLVLHTVRKIVQGFQQSSFFRTTLPDFIDKITEMNNSCFR